MKRQRNVFFKAIEINPNRLIHYIELGRIYAQMGRKEEARKIYSRRVLSMPNKEKDDPEMKAIGQQTLQKLGIHSPALRRQQSFFVT